MDKGYEFLMSVYNDIEAENVSGILEIEGIKTKTISPGSREIINTYDGRKRGIDIYVPKYVYGQARQIIETEMLRGDL